MTTAWQARLALLAVETNSRCVLILRAFFDHASGREVTRSENHHALAKFRAIVRCPPWVMGHLPVSATSGCISINADLLHSPKLAERGHKEARDLQPSPG